MRKPPRFWEKTFASLGFVRRKGKKPRSLARASRLMTIEPLEVRQLLSGVNPMMPRVTTLYWDPQGTNYLWDTVHTNWSTSSTGGTPRTWINGDTAVFAVAGVGV